MDMDAIFQYAVDNNASDIHLTNGLPPMVRINGELVAISNQEVLGTQELTPALLSLVNPVQKSTLEKKGQVDFSIGKKGIARFRVNIFSQRGTLAGVMRLIPSEISTLEVLGLPPALKSLTEKTRGMVLVTGPTGSGKSTTLAALIDIINMERNCHIITLEDPIEFLHRHKRSIINQREIGVDSISFADALRSALRQDPDVILVGEMRDLETISTAISAAETGHLVFATLHTNDSVQTVDRIVDMFPPHQQQQVRIQLSAVLQAVVSQQLLPRVDMPGRCVSVELMIATPAIRNLIRESKTHQIYSVIQTSGKMGMQTMDAALKDLYLRRLVSFQEALFRAMDQEEFRKLANM
ncbi:MAG: type IV pilus twitching motility protein PilT [Bacillota bacterium]